MTILSIKIVAQRMFSSSAKASSGYDKTVKNMLINKNTKVVCQGFTGKQVNAMSNIYRIGHLMTGKSTGSAPVVFWKGCHTD